MRLPIDDAVLLSLLVVFFAVQQRQRPESYFRFWLMGWVLVLISVLARVGLHYGLQPTLFEILHQDALVCGGIAFQFSSVVSGHRRRAAIIAALLIALPICAGLDIIVAGWKPSPVLALLVLIGEGISLAYAVRFSRGRAVWLLPLVSSLCVGNGILMLIAVVEKRATCIENLVLGQTFITAGLLLLGQKKVSAGRWAGFLGFLGWGVSHFLLSGFFPSRLLSEPVLGLWTIPKYLVAFGMILRLFSENNLEIAGLGSRYRRLYEDYRVLYQGNPHPMWIYDEASSRFLSVNDSAIRAYGFTADEFLVKKVTDLAKPISTEQKTLSTEEEANASGRSAPARHHRANGTTFDVDLTEQTITFQGKAARFVLAVDITEREDLNRELVYQAQHDVLTGLPNRMVLEDRLMHWVARCDRESTMGALLTIDIDHFKRVNDTYGHLIGDQCLVVTAERLRSRVRQVDTIARTGGEEFTIVVGNLRSREGAEKVCSVLLQIFQDPIVLENGLELRVTISIGTAMYPADGTNLDELRRQSDQALYQAKRKGRNRAVFASGVEHLTPDLGLLVSATEEEAARFSHESRINQYDEATPISAALAHAHTG